MDRTCVERLLREAKAYGDESTTNGGAEIGRRELLASTRKLVTALELHAEVLDCIKWLEVSKL